MISRCEPMAGSARPKLPAGFTLIELLIVLAILGLGLALVVGYKPPWSSTVVFAPRPPKSPLGCARPAPKRSYATGRSASTSTSRGTASRSARDG